MTHAAGYLRRSSVSSDSPGDASREAQEAAVTRLGATELYVDWGVSGRRTDRQQYLRLKADIEAGKVHAVYAYSLSRLGRNARELDALFTLCEDRGIPVQTEVEGALAGKGAFGGFMRRVLAALAELESELAAERSAAARAIQRERGDRLGQAPLGYVAVRNEEGVRVFVPDPRRPADPVLQAYEEAGTVLGAVKLLTERGVPSAKGKAWGTSMVTRTLRNHGIDLPRGKRGRPSQEVALLTRLLRCHCGSLLTPNRVRGQYYCPRGHVTPGHGRYNVTEASLMPWVKEEASRLRAPASIVDVRSQDDDRRFQLIEKRDRVVEAFLDGILTKADRDERLAAIDRELSTLDGRADVLEVPDAIDWTWDTASINEVLRATWDVITLDQDLRPVAATWRVPQWRAA